MFYTNTCSPVKSASRTRTRWWLPRGRFCVALVRHRVGDRLLRVVDVASGSGLIVFGGLLGYRTLHERA